MDNKGSGSRPWEGALETIRRLDIGNWYDEEGALLTNHATVGGIFHKEIEELEGALALLEAIESCIDYGSARLSGEASGEEKASFRAEASSKGGDGKAYALIKAMLLDNAGSKKIKKDKRR